MKLNLREKSKVEIKRMFMFFAVMMCLTMVDCKQGIVAAEEHNAHIQVNQLEGRLSINVVDSSLKSVLQDIGNKAGFRVSLYGLEDEIITKSFTNEPLERGIRKIIGSRSVSFLYQTSDSNSGKPTQNIKIVWVFDSNGRDSGSAGSEVQGEMDNDPGGIAPVVNVAEHANFRKPVIKLDYDLTSEEGLYVNTLINGNDRAAREEALAKLVEMDTDSAIAAISVAFDDKDPRFRKFAVENLAESKNPLSEQLIGQALFKDDDTEVAISAAHAFQGRDSQIAQEFLYSASMSHKNMDVWSAVRKMLHPETFRGLP